MRFKYSGYKDNKKVSSFIEANSLEEAKEILLNSGVLIIDIKPIKTLNLSFSKKISKKELARVLHILGLYLKSSIPLIQAINLTKSQIEDIKVIKFLDTLSKEIKEGKNFYNALTSQKILKLPKYIINAIKVGEESGKLDIVLIQMSKFLKDEDKIASKTTQSLIYPMFIIVVAIFMVGFMLSVVVPKIVKIFKNLNQDLPTITKIVISAGDFIKSQGVNLLIIFFIITIIFYHFYQKNYKFKFFIHSLMLKIPILNKIIITKELGRFSYLVYILVKSGVNYLNAVNLAANTIENEKIKSFFIKAIEDVKLGKKLSTSLAKVGFDIDKSFISSVALAEETGEIADVLENVSEIYFEENQNKINTLLNMIEPTLMIVIGTIIGFIVTAMLLPMFKMNLLSV